MTRTLPTYQIYVDWNGDNDYADTGEDVSTRVLPDFTCERGRDQVRALAPPMAGKGGLKLDNRSKDYSPDYASSPLYGNLIPGRSARAQLSWSATTYYLFTGIVDDVQPNPARGERSATIPLLGSLSSLKGKKISTQLYTNVRTDQALGYLLDAVGWPSGSGSRVLATGYTTLLYWWCDEVDAWDMAVMLLNTEGPGAALYEDGQGRIVFEDRYYRVRTTRANTSQGTFSDVGGSGVWHRQPFGYNAGLKGVINQAIVSVNARTTASLAVIWQYGSTLTLAPYAVAKLTVKASADIFTAAVAPVAATDYTVSAGGVSSVTLSRTSGANTTITITAGSGGATITGLQLRAQAINKVTYTIPNTIDTSASVAKFKARPYTRTLWPEIDPNVAQDFANAIASAYQQPRAMVSITVDNANDDMASHVFSREISDRITIVETETGLNRDCYIERIAHRITKAGKQHEAVFGCEVTDAIPDWMIWGTGRWGYSMWGW